MVAIAQIPDDHVEVKILIVDDHPVTREGLAVCLARQNDLELCGEAENISGALQQVATVEPDIAIVDISLRGDSGIDLIKRIRDRSPRTRVLIWSMYSESDYAERALRAGASGYVEKTESSETLIAAIRQVVSGGIHLSQRMTDLILRRAAFGGSRVGCETDPVALLTNREMEVFRLLGRGYETKQVADHMHLSPKTVATYLARIKIKFGVDSLGEILRCAMRWDMENGASGMTLSGPDTCVTSSALVSSREAVTVTSP